ncbi:MAG: hypothetical protein KDA61_14320 [Planctomycetales bacterium]|nr:hypothetical protein [Planctomycetales bacterium]
MSQRILAAALLSLSVALGGSLTRADDVQLRQPDSAVTPCGCDCAPDCGCADPVGCGDGCCGANACGACGGCNQCGACCTRDVCVGSVDVGKEEKHCWKVKCDKVCVPGIRFPWEKGSSGLTLFSWAKKHKKGDCCGDACCGDGCCGNGCCGNGSCGTCCKCCPAPKCGRVKCVRDIEKETYECDVCEYSWEVMTVPACGCGGNGCGVCGGHDCTR